MIKKIIQSDGFKNEIRDLKSLRVKLVIFIAIIWTYVIVNIPKNELKDILWHITFLFTIMILIYVLGKQNFRFKLGPMEFELDSKNKTESTINNEVNKQ